MLLKAVKDNRETFAWVLTGFVATSVLVEFVALFIDQGFVSNAAGGHLRFVSPLLAAALAVAVLLVSLGDEPTKRARPVVQVVLGVAGAMLLLGFVSWLAGLTVETFQQSAAFRTVNSLRFLLGAAVVGAAGWFGWLVLEALPAPARSTQRRGLPSGWDLQRVRSRVAARIAPRSSQTPEGEAYGGTQQAGQRQLLGAYERPGQEQPAHVHPAQPRRQSSWPAAAPEPAPEASAPASGPASEPAPEPAPETRSPASEPAAGTGPAPEPALEPAPEPDSVEKTQVFDALPEDHSVGLSIFDSSPDSEADARDNSGIGDSTDDDMGTTNRGDSGDEPGTRRRW